jgi:hypothetical protein
MYPYSYNTSLEETTMTHLSYTRKVSKARPNFFFLKKKAQLLVDRAHASNKMHPFGFDYSIFL